MWRLVTSIMIATERRWRSTYKAKCCWWLSTHGLKLKLLRLLHNSLPQARAASGDARRNKGDCGGRSMPSPSTLGEWGLRAEVREIPAKTSLEGGLDVRARRLDDGLCCLTEDAIVELNRVRCSFFSGSPLLRNGRLPTVIPVKMSAFHVETGHFYHNNYWT